MDKSVSLRHRVSTYTGYIILGFAFGMWAMLVPFVKDRLLIDKAELGLLLLQIAFGAVISMFFTGFTAAKIGCRKTVILSTLLIIICLLVLSVSKSIFIMAVFMFLFGAALGMLDVTLNIQGAIVEEGMKKHLMAGFHSMYSFGVFFGILIETYLLKHLTPVNTVFIITGLIFILLIFSIPALLNYGGEVPQKLFIKPTRILFMLGMICFIAFVAEGVILDWSALFMREVRNIEPQYAGYSFSLFYITMGIFRLLGDKIADKFSIKQILFTSSLTAVTGILIMLYIPYHWASFLGFTLAGAGLANMVPVTISAAGRYKGSMPLSIAVSAVSTVGYFGTLFGPSVMGFVSEMTNLTTAFTLIACSILIITFLSKGFK